MDRAHRSVESRPSAERQAAKPARLNGGAVLALQRKAGNAAVARLVRASRSRPPTRKLARFGGAEHEDIGNAINTKIDLGGGVVLTWGQVVAIAGDEYGTLEQLLSDAKDPARRWEIRAALENAETKGPTSSLPKPTDDQKKAHELTYFKLAFDNADHFPDSGRALLAWKTYHSRALSTAATAGIANNPDGINLAYANEAFGQHFLTDCYSGGHLRTPRAQIIDWYVKTWAPRAVPALLDSIQDEMIDRLTAEADPQTHVPHHFVREDVEDRVHGSIHALTAKLGGAAELQRWIGLGVAGALSGTIHDAEGAAGVVVSSTDHPAAWIAYGDGKLSSSPISRAQAVKAILAAKDQVDRAYLIGEEVGAQPENASFPERTKNRALIRVHNELEPSERAIERFIPRPVEERPASPTGGDPLPKTSNTPLPEWKWGNLSGQFADTVNQYVKDEVGTKLMDAVKSAKELDEQVSDAWYHAKITVHPRPVIEDIVKRFMAAPLDELGRRIGWPARAPVKTSGPKVPAGVP